MHGAATTETAIAKTSGGPMGYGSLAPNTEHARMSMSPQASIISYLLYLWHWPAIIFANSLAGGQLGHADALFALGAMSC
jgi:hypothetical protein